jgi:hypothetical protein
MLVTDAAAQTLTHILPLDGATPAQLDVIFAELEQRALQELMEENFPRERYAPVARRACATAVNPTKSGRSPSLTGRRTCPT